MRKYKLIDKITKKFSDFLRFRSIQSIITVSFAFIAVFAVVFISMTLSGRFSKSTEQSVAISTMQVIEQVSLNIDTYQKNMEGFLNLIEENIEKSNSIRSKELEDKMNVMLELRDDIVEIAVFNNAGELVIGDPFGKLKRNVDIKSQNWFAEAQAKKGDMYLSSPHVQNLFEVKHNWVLSLSKTVTFNENGKEQSGVLLIDLNFNTIEQLCQKVGLGQRGYIYIIDAGGNIIYHPHQQLVYAGLKNENIGKVLKSSYGTINEKVDGEERLLTVKSVGNSGWKIAGISYMDDLKTIKNNMSNFSMIILIFTTIFIVFLFILISAKITKPIKQLDSSMKKVEEGDFNTTVEIKGDKEVVHLSKTFNLMVSRIRQLMEQIVVEQEAKRKSELNALQAQINPHFLYNTLDSIVWMAENGKSEDVVTMVTSLARLFRISISRGRNIVTVREEIEHARNYLTIQKVRFKTKFHFSIEVEEEVLELKTLKLILQPIIENALYHGIQYMVEEGSIKVTAQIYNGKLLFEVIDNGLGIDPEKLKNILSYNSKENGGAGVGVRNVHERIQLCYSKEYGADIESELEEGTTVKLWLPIVKDESDEK